MRTIISTIILTVSLSGNASTLVHNGNVYNLESKESILKCSKFSIYTKTISFPFSLRENNIPYEKTMKHMGNAHLISQKLIFSNTGVENELPDIISKLSDYKKIDKKRSYIISPVKCLGESSVLLSLWGGGNCSTVCEAYAKATLTKNGVLSSISGLTYKEYSDLRKNN